MRKSLGTMFRLMLLGIVGCTSQASDRARLSDAYQQSITLAAVKSPNYVRKLQKIDLSQSLVEVVHVQSGFTINPNKFVWVARRNELLPMCHGKADPLLAIQQALGLPPEARNDVRVFSFNVSPKDLFRPCASSPDIDTDQCAVDTPQETKADPVVEHFVLKQMMDSYRAGFDRPGYPFTAMGWSYNWDPASTTHQGVSEYVVKPHAQISDVVSTDPAAFCGRQ